MVVFLLELIEPNIEGNMCLKREIVHKSLDQTKMNTVVFGTKCPSVELNFTNESFLSCFTSLQRLD